MVCRRSLIYLSKILLDLSVLVSAFCLACVLRFEGTSPQALSILTTFLPYLVVGKLALLGVAGWLRSPWRYTSLRDALWILNWCGVSAMALLAWRLAGLLSDFGPERLLGETLPIGVILIDLVLSFVGLLGIRALVRLFCEYRERLGGRKAVKVPTLLIGAGRAGAMVAREIGNRHDLNVLPVGFLDDDPHLAGMQVSGIPVLGSIEDVGVIARRYNVQQALITIASASGAAIRRIVQVCKASGLEAKIIPPLHEIVGGHLNLSRIRQVALEDLLRRNPVSLDCDQVRAMVRNRPVLVTGAGGSIGSELCRTVASFNPGSLILVERAENSLFLIHSQLVRMFPDLVVVPCIADICDGERMETLFAAHRPSLVFHAAAHKHVPMMEWNPSEAVKNNVLGTRALALLADAWGVERFVMISTDKAVNPTSVMGVSKRIAELFVQAFSLRSETQFMTVRFGNVLGSAGSVIPIFQEQIANGGPVTITHPEMRRYFMTIPEACQLVLQSASMGSGGEIFILDMGEPVKIVDIARDLIHLSGLVPEQDVEIRFTGIRPGEKLFEELFLGAEQAKQTRHKRIFIGQTTAPSWQLVERLVRELGSLADGPDPDAIFAKFREIVPEYQQDRPRIDQPVAVPIKPMHAFPKQEQETAAKPERSRVPLKKGYVLES